MADATVGLLRVVLASNSAQFDASMDKSGAKVEAFGQAGRRAAASLARMVGDFNGNRVTAEATKMAAAIEKVGGVSKLTDNELGRVNRTLDNAIAKYRILGQEAPPQITKLKNEVAALGTASGGPAAGGVSKLSGAVGMLGKVLPALGIATVIGSLVRLGTAALAAADKHVTFADKLGVSTEATQRWEYVAGQTGTTMEAFGNNAYKLGINISAGSTKARDAIADLGLAYSDLKNLKPEQQFDAVVRALEGVESATERNRIGQALFGKQFSEIAAAVASGYTKMKDEASVSSDAQVRAAERAGDAWERMKTRVSRSMLSLVGTASEVVEDVIAAYELGLPGAMDKFTKDQQEHIKSILGAGFGGVAHYLRQLEGARKTDIDLTRRSAEAQTDYVARLAAVRAEVNGLTSSQRAQIDAALKLTGATEELADEVGISAEALRMYASQGKGAVRATSEVATEMDRGAESARKFAESVKFVQVAMKGYVTMPKGVADTSAEIATIREEMEAMASIRTMDAIWPPFIAGVKESGDGVAALAQKLRLMAGLKDDIAGIFQSIPSTIAQALLHGGGIGDALKSVTSQLGSKFAQLGAAAIGFAGPWGQAVAGAIGALTPMISKLWGGASKEVLEARKQVDAFEASMAATLTASQKAEAGNEKWKMTVIAVRDAYIATGRTAAEAEAIVKKLWNTDNPKAAARAMEEINRVLEEQKRLLAENQSAANTLFDDIMAAGSEGIPAAYRPAIEQLISLGLLTDEQAAKLRGLSDSTGVSVSKMTDAMELFKGRIESLGPAYRQAKLDETSKKYINAMDSLIKGGADVGGVLFDAREEFGALVAEAIRGGQTLPANMKPWIDDLFNAGNLLDENGQKITDISGLKYGEAQKTEAEIAEEGWNKILAAIQELIDKINGPLNRAINNIPDKTVKIGADTGDLDRALERGGYRRPDDGRDDGKPLSTGTIGAYGKWFGDFAKSGSRAVLHGAEAVLRPKDAIPFALDTLSGLIPEVPSIPSLAPAFAGPSMVSGDTTTSNNYVMVAIPVEAAGDSFRITREVVRALPQSIRMNEAELRVGIERVIEDYDRTYRRGTGS